MTPRLRNWILLTGDLATTYLAAGLAIALRGGVTRLPDLWDEQLLPFTVLHLIWIASLFVGDFYTRRRLKVGLEFLQALVRVSLINALAGVVLFYLIQAFGITPKSILALEIVIFAVLFFLWRRAISPRLIDQTLKPQALLLAMDEASERLTRQLADHPEFDYRLITVKDVGEGIELTDTVIVGNGAYDQIADRLYQMLLTGRRVLDAASFWEEQQRRVPIRHADESWILAGFRDVRKPEYEIVKRGVDVLLALVIGLLIVWILPLIVLAVRLSGPGPILYRQRRIGRFGHEFTLRKFRSMVADAESDGAKWAAKNDARVTRVGKFLRHTHLDELPQLLNILAGEMSFIGPRPERPEFVAELQRLIPHYALRHLIRPGITGWAQINYRYGASIDDAAEKLTYDLYYVKHRSLALDVKILLKTAAMVFRGEGR